MRTASQVRRASLKQSIELCRASYERLNLKSNKPALSEDREGIFRRKGKSQPWRAVEVI